MAPVAFKSLGGAAAGGANHRLTRVFGTISVHEGRTSLGSSGTSPSASKPTRKRDYGAVRGTSELITGGLEGRIRFSCGPASSGSQQGAHSERLVDVEEDRQGLGTGP